MPLKNKTEYGASFKADFYEKYAFFASRTKTFSKRAFEHITARNWNASIFSSKTALADNFYYRLKNDEISNPEFENVIAICIGLRLTKWERNELFELAGYTFKNTLLHFAYLHILDECNIRNIDDFNTAFMALEIEGHKSPPLKSYR